MRSRNVATELWTRRARPSARARVTHVYALQLLTFWEEWPQYQIHLRFLALLFYTRVCVICVSPAKLHTPNRIFATAKCVGCWGFFQK